MPWTKKARVNETIAFVQGYGALPVNVRNDLATFLGTCYPRTTALQKQAFDTLAGEMSVKAHGVGPVGDTQQRRMRRAIMLLWMAMSTRAMDPTGAQAKAHLGMSLLLGALPAALDNAMLKACVMASAAGAAHVFNLLCAHPQAFLRDERLFIEGSTAGADKFKLAGLDYTNVQAFRFFYDPHRQSFLLTQAAWPALGPGHTVNAVSVPAIHWSDVPGVGGQPGNFSGILATTLAGANIMVTTQFSGCSFCYLDTVGGLQAAHISPAGDQNKPSYTGGGLALATRIAGPGNGAFSNALGAGAISVFGNGAGNAAPHSGGNGFYPPKNPIDTGGQMKWMTTFGVRKGGGAWRLYTQSVDGVLTIMPGEVRRLL